MSEKVSMQLMGKKRNEHPNVGGISIRSRNGAPSRKGCVVNGQMARASNKSVQPPLPLVCTNFEPAFVHEGKSAKTERCRLWTAGQQYLDQIFPKSAASLCVPPLRGLFGENRLGNPYQEVCYLNPSITLIPSNLCPKRDCGSKKG